MRDDSEWGFFPGVVPPPSTPAGSTPSRTPVFVSPVVLPPYLSPAAIPPHYLYSPFVPQTSTPLPQTPVITPGVVPLPPPPLLFTPPPEETTTTYFPRATPSPSNPPVIPPNLSSPASQASPSSVSSHSGTPDLHPPSRNSSSPVRGMPASNPDIFIPPEVQPTPPPQSDQRHRRRPSGPLVGESQGWAYPLDLGGTGLSYPNHSTPYNPYTPLPALYPPAYGGYTPYPYPPCYPPFTPRTNTANLYTPYPYPPYYPPFTPRTNPANPYTPYHPYSQYYPPQSLPPYTTPVPFQVSTIHNYNTPYLPPTSQLPNYALPGDTPLPATSVPLPPPQPGFISLHPDIFTLGGGMTALDWDLLYPPTPEYAKLVNPPMPYARPNFSEPAFSSPMVAAKVHLRSSSHPVLAYWMDIWGCLTVNGVPTVRGLLEGIYSYLHMPLTPSELELLLSTPENKENVARARTIRAREGCELVLGGGYKRLDVLGMHRKFAGVWVGSVSECVDEQGGEGSAGGGGGGGIEVELMIGIRPGYALKPFRR
ncbi:hypothetical protein E1B28_013280 [Marasmius oreades]|uniref:DUF6699 domain-containing protein n=1 Tax=Marasmius oreades TaxID=181124 RepID=A0A9P7ULW7_9AGAR|nr:uncharacterized protein E1B28_013280 [Marasmius oreades]KAG7087302.1 hypothetical protein E1B28_013280 [Marasmius oreades]